MRLLNIYIISLLVLWTALLCSLLFFDIKENKEETDVAAKLEARANFRKDQAIRYWANSHGGIYVPIDSITKPNPYLKHVFERDIETPSGVKLTLLNPAYIVRQLNESFKEDYGVVGKITGKNVLRKENKPDKWEINALNKFNKGIKEVSEYSTIDGEVYLRLMQPMITNESCLKCHSEQGYKVGNTDGGVSVSIPMKPYFDRTKHHNRRSIISFFVIWTLGIIGLVYGNNVLSNIFKKKLITKRNLLLKNKRIAESEENLNDIFNSFTDIYFEADIGGKLKLLSPSVEEITGYKSGELLGSIFSDKFKHQEQRNEIKELFQLKGEVIHFEVIYIKKDDTEVLLEINSKAITNKRGEFIGVKGTVRNISDREKLQSTTARLNEKETMLKEIHHRVKNNLQVITSLLSLQSSVIEEDKIKYLFLNAQYRIKSMSIIHEMLYQSDNLSQINYKEYIEKLLSFLLVSMKGNENNITLKITSPDVCFNIDTSIPLGLLITEIVTNSLKYGIKNDNKGVISIKLEQVSPPNYIIRIGDDGGGFSDDITIIKTKSLGLKLIDKLAMQLKGKIEIDSSKKGVCYIISFQEIGLTS